ncbi:prolipoprotein diacylglyceryl transferase [Klebsiella pneumoniae]|nr:prolipoprotein diacylglyceryl transferase [Klebsiella pneumoniae]
MATCIFRKFDPVIFSLGPVSLHWYGLMYLVGFVFAMWLATRRANRPGSGWTKNEVENLLYAGFLGVFLGGRIGYVLFYNLPVFLCRSGCTCSASGTAACRSTAA